MKPLLLILFCLPMLASGQNANIIGDWYNAEKDAVITIFEEKANSNEKATIAGKISWMKDPLDGKGNPKTDNLNPDKKLQKRKRLGARILYGFIYQGGNVWENGEVYDPKKGKTYGGEVTLTSENKLDLRGHLLWFPLIGRSSTWTRKIN